mmetsp:Transcript_109055/g.243367  ORF Transcript_109055/g.243367 Transcript_109055/m.243367 type:complete len:238 (-) Transcript_109055:84-797(-)
MDLALGTRFCIHIGWGLPHMVAAGGDACQGILQNYRGARSDKQGSKLYASQRAHRKCLDTELAGGPGFVRATGSLFACGLAWVQKPCLECGLSRHCRLAGYGVRGSRECRELALGLGMCTFLGSSRCVRERETPARFDRRLGQRLADANAAKLERRGRLMDHCHSDRVQQGHEEPTDARQGFEGPHGACDPCRLGMLGHGGATSGVLVGGARKGAELLGQVHRVLCREARGPEIGPE